MQGIGLEIQDKLKPLLEGLVPFLPGDTFPILFQMEMMQRSLIASLMVAIVAGVLGVFLIIQNLSLIGDGLAHVSFGGVAVAIVLGATNPLWYALLFSVIAAILIHELQARDILTGDASIAIFLTGVLSVGLISLTVWGGGVTADIHSYLFGSQLLIDKDTLNWITYVCIFVMVTMILIGPSLLACIIDPLAARVQGLPVKGNRSSLQHSHSRGGSNYGQSRWSIIGYCAIGNSSGYCTTSWK